MKKIIIWLCIMLLLVFASYALLNSFNNESDKKMEDDNMIEDSDMSMKDFNNRIIFNINGFEFIATLEDNETSRRFYALLPLDLSMADLNNNEKYSYLDITLPTNSKDIKTIKTGDIMLYGDHCLVLFYESFDTSYSYTKIGKIDNINNLKNVVGKDNINIRIYSDDK